MGEQAIFKTSALGGFEKKGVLSYIDEMNNQAKQAQESLNQRLEEMSAARNDLSKQVEAFEATITQLEDQIKSEREKIGELTGVIHDLNAELTTQKRTVQDREAELRVQNERNRQLQFKAESLEYKSHKYEETTMQVGEIIVEAKQTAEHILMGARREARQLRESTGRSIEIISQEIGNFRSDVACLRESIVGVMGSISSKLDELDESVNEIEARCHTLEEDTQSVLHPSKEEGKALPPPQLPTQEPVGKADPSPEMLFVSGVAPNFFPTAANH